MIIIDTDILIDAGRCVDEALSCLQQVENKFSTAVSSVTQMELIVGYCFWFTICIKKSKRLQIHKQLTTITLSWPSSVGQGNSGDILLIFFFALVFEL